MAYKVLGQVTTTAPASALEITNYLPDSSFTAYPITSNITLSATNGATVAINAATPWRWASQSYSSCSLTSTAVNTSVTTPFGPTGSAYGVTSGTTNFFTIGYAIGSEPSNVATNTSMDKATAILVTGGTTYNYGYSYYPVGSTTTPRFRVSWYSSSDSYISQSQLNPGPGTANVWRRVTGTITAPSNAVRAIMHWSADSSIEFYLDGMVFGPSSTYASTFTEPLLPSIAKATSPYDKTINGFITESVFSYSGSAVAGGFVTAYTVPAGKEAVVSTLAITNFAGTAATYRVAVIKSGDTLSSENILFLDTPIAASTTQAITIGMTLAAGDVVRVAGSTAYINATLFGSES
jgi:hypothetical protein